MDKIYYNSYYHLERENWWFKVRANIIIEYLERTLKPNQTRKILNVGAATGHTSKLLERFGDVTSVEYDKDCFDFTKERLNINIVNASATDLPFDDNAFDLVCCFDVIEHIAEDDLAVKEMARVCSQGGMLCLTVPAFMSIWSEHDEINHHERRYVLPQMRALFKNLSGDISYQTYFCSLLFIPLYIFRNTLKLVPKQWIRKGAGSDFELFSQDNLVNKILYTIFNIERPLLRKVTFPFGSSILFSWTKGE
jgi:ubiquinone/menaquinone biosynthesis C-methylase UbiE